jgi:phosphatidylglycerol lysyltransferase
MNPAEPPPASRWRRELLALAVATMGIVDLASALLSHPPERVLALRHLVPTDVLDTSRTFTLLAGALLLVTAWGLRRGKRRAYVTALLLCAVSVPVNLLKALDVEEATVAAGLMFALGVSADAFQVRSRELSSSALRSRVAISALALLVYILFGSWMLERLFGVEPSLRRAFADSAHRMFGIGPSVELVPSHALRPVDHHILVWYLRSLPILTLVLALGAAIASLRPARHRRRHRAEADRVQALLPTADSSVAWFALADDSDYFFSRNQRAVIAYKFESDTLLAIGDPIGPVEEHRPLLEEFAAFCAGRDWQFAFFQARPEHLPLYRSLGWSALHIGEEPVIDPRTFTLEGSAMGNVRRTARKAGESGITVRHFRPDAERFDPAHAPHGWLEQLRTVSDEWLRGQGGERGFCMGRFEPARLGEEWLSVAWNERAARIEAFATWIPVPARHGWALDLMRRRADAVAGVMDLLVVRSVEHARERGDAMLSLSLSALANVETQASGAEPDPVREFLVQHLARFYDFKGLFEWKRKFAPSFEDRYLVHPSPLALPRVALALVRAQSRRGLWSYFQRPPRVAPRPQTELAAPGAV